MLQIWMFCAVSRRDKSLRQDAWMHADQPTMTPEGFARYVPGALIAIRIRAPGKNATVAIAG